MNLYFLHYNNYYNRIIKKFDTLNEYLVLPYYDGAYIQNCAFDPNDSVETRQILNNYITNSWIDSCTYDYLIVADGTTIKSRWFIMEIKRERNGQFNISLRRDLFADTLSDIRNAPAFIEKATLFQDDPMIFNKEDMSYNQIKKSETLLKDKTKTPWIVGYLEKNTDMPNSRTIEYNSPQPYANLSAFESDFNALRAGYNGNYICVSEPNSYKYLTEIKYENIPNSGVYQPYRLAYYDDNSNPTPQQILSTNSNLIVSNLSVNQPRLNATNIEYQTNFRNTANLKSTIDTALNLISTTQINAFLNYNGKILYDTANNKYYKVNISSTYHIHSQQILTGSLFNIFKNVTDNCSYITGTPNIYSYKLEYNGTDYTYSLTEVSGENAVYKIENNNVNKLSDAPYIMFAIPYGAAEFTLAENPVVNLSISESDGKSIALSVANDIIEQFGGTSPKLYDIQLLPYCPFQDSLDANGKVYFAVSKQYSKILDANNNLIGIICFADRSRFTFNIPQVINVTDKKIENECDKYRLCSPNWNGQFEFSAAKNGGVTSINVDCEYKPFQPYIHLNPNFGLLYGQDFDDARGLICNGDFSLTQISDAWATYQRQNVNYEKQFNRQIQNMEVNNNIQNIKAATSAVTGTVQGALLGLVAGGPAGAILGGAASGVGGAMDYALNKAAQAEAIDYTKDQFGYNLGNIQALPDSLTKVSAFNNNNKIFPVLEYYSCTDEEKQALRDKLKYNGMTVMRIGTLNEFIRQDISYIKGKFIRLNIDEDFHFVNELANEFNKGVFI